MLCLVLFSYGWLRLMCLVVFGFVWFCLIVIRCLWLFFIFAWCGLTLLRFSLCLNVCGFVLSVLVWLPFCLVLFGCAKLCLVVLCFARFTLIVCC